MAGLEWAAGHDPLPDILERFITQGQAGLDAGIAALAEVVEADMVGVLTEQEHAPRTPTPASQGGPPAKISGRLAEAVHKAVKFRKDGAIAFIGPVGDRAHIAKFMENGWHPIHGKQTSGRRRRRSRYERRTGSYMRTVSESRFPFLGKVRAKAIAQAGPIVTDAVRFHLGGDRL